MIPCYAMRRRRNFGKLPSDTRGAIGNKDRAQKRQISLKILNERGVSEHIHVLLKFTDCPRKCTEANEFKANAKFSGKFATLDTTNLRFSRKIRSRAPIFGRNSTKKTFFLKIYVHFKRQSRSTDKGPRTEMRDRSRTVYIYNVEKYTYIYFKLIENSCCNNIYFKYKCIYI